MASEELQRNLETVEMEDRRSEMGSDKHKNRAKKNEMMKKKKKKTPYLPRFGCFKSKDDYPTIDESKGGRSFDMEATTTGNDRSPTHLVIMVNGIIGSAQNWRFAAKQFVKEHPHDVIVHCSECNTALLTFDGVDVMGNRLADEVMSVIKRHPGLQRISFIGHSLGGLVARYAIAKLYKKDTARKDCQENGECRPDESNLPHLEEKSKGKIAGLEPLNFITSATPHLGSRGHKQIPMLHGSYTLEKVASRVSGFLGRTGKHLFLMDSDGGKPPLLLQMVHDCEDLQFMSALQCFRRRVAYANASFDHIVGWSSSSIRHRNELPKHLQLSRNDKYPYIVNVETSETATLQQEVSFKAKLDDGYNTDDMEGVFLSYFVELIAGGAHF
ncbi:unnamed protein product [Ilex paraguariensis]|uniref:DUF676 domain-containing protein n=1 Tax=Ilex paraguariensis TaxID=185542 RepID=A0ABC8TWQ9_9AQUA